MASPSQPKSKPTIICALSDISPNVKFGQGCIVHPGCTIYADEGSEIIFGNFNIIEERSAILNKPKKGKQPEVMKIGNYNLFEVGSVVENSNIGDYNLFQQKCHIEPNCQIPNQCILGPKVKLSSDIKLEDKSAVSFPCNVQIDSPFEKESFQQIIIEQQMALAKQLPTHNQIQQK